MAHFLKINAENDDPYLKKAIEIANLCIHTKKCTSTLEISFDIKYQNEYWKKCASNLKELGVVFEKDESKTSDLVWTYREEDESLNRDLKTIYINSRFRSRLQAINNQHDDESKMLVVFIGILIIHELGHLFVRWTVGPKTPPKFKVAHKNEAGYFMEKMLFGNIIYIFILRNKKWSEVSEYKGLAICEVSKNKMCFFEVSSSYINKVFYQTCAPEDYVLLETLYDPVDLNVYKAIRSSDENDEDSGSNIENMDQSEITILYNKCGLSDD